MKLRKYIIVRIIDSTIVIWLIFLMNFFLFYRVLPGIAELSIIDQFTSYLRFIFIDFFRTTTAEQDLIPGILSNFPFIILLWVFSITAAIILSIFSGILAVYKFKEKTNVFLTIAFISLFMIPSWWLSIVFQKYLAPPFPLTGWYSINTWTKISPWTNVLGFMQDVLWHMILPVMALTFSIIGVYFLVVRNSMASLLHEDFIALLKAKGLSSRKIFVKHVFRSALIPVVAITTLTPLIIINASVVVEKTFQLPGIGYFLYRSIIKASGNERGVPIPSVQAIFLLLAIIMVSFQFIFDIALHFLDPRLRLDGGEFKIARYSRKVKLGIFLKRFAKRKLGVIGLAIVVFFTLIAILAPFLPIYDPEEIVTSLGETPYTPPSFMHPLGTDEFGRDVLSRLIWGTRVSIAEFFGALIISLSIGCIIGLLSGYYKGKWFSYVLDRITDVFISIPLMVFILFFPLEPGWPKWILAVGTGTWGITAKIAKAQAITLKEKAYIEAARAAGAGNRYIILHYIFPEAFGVIASSLVYTASLIISLQSTLDYFGFRRLLWSTIDPVKTPPIITWGSLIGYSSTPFVAQNTWWIVIPPATCMALLGVSIVFVTDAISFALYSQTDVYESKPRVYVKKKPSLRIRGGIDGLRQKIKTHRRMVISLALIIILTTFLIMIPIAHVRIRNEAKSDLKEFIPCWGTLTSGQSWNWNITELSSEIRIVANVSSTRSVKIDITTLEGTIYSYSETVHNFVMNASGYYIYIHLENPASSELDHANVSGNIRIYHDYKMQVFYTEWLPWWMP